MAYGKITDKQREILEYIKNEILNRGFPPAVREICEAVNLKSTSSVHAHLESLEKNGYIRRDPTKPRAIEIVDDNFNLVRREMVNVPVLGRVAAGEPLLAIENVESYFPIPAEFMPNAQTFILNVVGESMINAGILDGDKVIVEQTADAQNGDIVVALVDDSATVKRFYKEKDCYRLQPVFMSVIDLPFTGWIPEWGEDHCPYAEVWRTYFDKYPWFREIAPFYCDVIDTTTIENFSKCLSHRITQNVILEGTCCKREYFESDKVKRGEYTYGKKEEN